MEESEQYAKEKERKKKKRSRRKVQWSWVVRKSIFSIFFFLGKQTNIICVVIDSSERMGKKEEYYKEQREADVETEEEEEEEEEESDSEEKWRKHYSSGQRILLVGEGDFSFSLSLATHFGSARNMVATSLDSQEKMAGKYSNAIENVRKLEERGCIVIYGVDAQLMSQHFFLATQRFDRIVYNFPHVGFLFREDSFCQIQLNKRLVKGFFKNAKLLLRKEGGGEIHITHKEGHPYKEWDLVRKAYKIGLQIDRSVPFCKDDYPGYHNKRGHGIHSDAPFHLGDCTTYMFKIRLP